MHLSPDAKRRAGHHAAFAMLYALLTFVVPAQAATRAGRVEVSSAETAEQAGLVDLRTLVPNLALDIRYAGSNNFTGRPVPGYLAAKCLLLRRPAEALAALERRLNADGYALKVFDCYRPVRSVQAFVAWAGDPADQIAKSRFYPEIDKDRLLGDYIAESSSHSRGATVDLTLLDCHGGRCRPLDMGTGFDYFGVRAHTRYGGLSAAQQANRQRLLDAMASAGFGNYPMEWWHYTFRPEPSPKTAFDVPIR